MSVFPKYPKAPSPWISTYRTGRAQPRAGFGAWTTGAWGTIDRGWAGDAETRLPIIEQQRDRLVDRAVQFGTYYGVNTDNQNAPGPRKLQAPTEYKPKSFDEVLASARAGKPLSGAAMAGRVAGSVVLGEGKDKASRSARRATKEALNDFDAAIGPPPDFDNWPKPELPKPELPKPEKRKAGAKLSGIDKSDWTI